jgi:hypothetical protein
MRRRQNFAPGGESVTRRDLAYVPMPLVPETTLDVSDHDSKLLAQVGVADSC